MSQRTVRMTSRGTRGAKGVSHAAPTSASPEDKRTLGQHPTQRQCPARLCRANSSALRCVGAAAAVAIVTHHNVSDANLGGFPMPFLALLLSCATWAPTLAGVATTAARSRVSRAERTAARPFVTAAGSRHDNYLGPAGGRRHYVCPAQVSSKHTQDYYTTAHAPLPRPAGVGLASITKVSVASRRRLRWDLPAPSTAQLAAVPRIGRPTKAAQVHNGGRAAGPHAIRVSRAMSATGIGSQRSGGA